MIVIPAIDLKDGKCVRLLQGMKEEVTVYSKDPSATAKQCASFGAELLHIVDLDGAFSGEQKNIEQIRSIRRTIDIPIEVGGGIRNMERIDELISLGVDRVIIGTLAAKNPDIVRKACDRYPGKVLVGIDARDGKVAIRGWEEVTEIGAVELATQMQNSGTAGIIYTDIEETGCFPGPILMQ